MIALRILVVHWGVCRIGILAAVLLATWGIGFSQDDRIRVQSVVVPVDVVVTDSAGQVVTDLAREDFAVFEDGKRQVVTSFAQYPFENPVSLDRPETNVDQGISSATHLVLVFGRGRHDIFGGISALKGFVESQIPDSVRTSIVAYNRASPFTSDQGQLLSILDRYIQKSPAIEAALDQYLTGLTLRYWTGTIPEKIQSLIDEIFPPMPVMVGRLGGRSSGDRADTLDSYFLSSDSLDAFLSAQVRSSFDVETLNVAVRYLGTVEGEKHVLFFTSQGANLSGLEEEGSIARLASDARVRIHVFQTGGVQLKLDSGLFPWGGPAALGHREIRPQALMTSTLDFVGARENFFAISAVRKLAQLTGGFAFTYKDMGDSLRQFRETLRSVYFLAYEPPQPDETRRFRRIEVKAKRAGLRVFHRSGYYSEPISTLEFEEHLLRARITAIALHTGDLEGIEFQATAQQRNSGKEQSQVEMKLGIQSIPEMFSRVGSRYRGRLIIKYMILSDSGRLWDRWDSLETELTEATFDRVLKEAIPVHAEFQIPEPKFKGWGKILVYCRQSGLIGSRTIKITGK